MSVTEISRENIFFKIPASALSDCTESSSPRMKRSNKFDNNSSVENPELKRRGSMDCILEEGAATITAGVATSFVETRGKQIADLEK